MIQDGDMEYSPELIPYLVSPILQDKSDVVFGSRFAGKQERMSLSHYMGNKMLSLTARLLFGAPITDIMTGSKAFSREVVNSFDLHEDGFGVEIEMTSKSLQNGWRFTEVPMKYEYRKVGSSKIHFSDGVKLGSALFKHLFKQRALTNNTICSKKVYLTANKTPINCGITRAIRAHV